VALIARYNLLPLLNPHLLKKLVIFPFNCCKITWDFACDETFFWITICKVFYFINEENLQVSPKMKLRRCYSSEKNSGQN
jgi:hypothetical protein